MAPRHKFTPEESRKGGLKRAREMWREIKELRAKKTEWRWKTGAKMTDEEVLRGFKDIPLPPPLAPPGPDPHRAAALAFPPGVWHPDIRVRIESGIEPPEEEADQEAQGEDPAEDDAPSGL